MKVNDLSKQSEKNALMSKVIVLLTVINLIILFIPLFSPVRFLPQLEHWSYWHLLGNAMEIDKIFATSYPGVREFFANNAIAIFCGYVIGIFAILQLISGFLMLSKDTGRKVKGLLLLSIFSLIEFAFNLILIADMIGANTQAAKPMFIQMGIVYNVPLGAFVLLSMAVLLFLMSKVCRRRILIEKNLLIRMTHREKVENLKGFAFISPYIIGFSCFTAFPLIFSFFSSFTYYNITAVQKWYSISNFTKLFFNDDYFWKSLYNTVWYVVISVPLAIIFSMFLALLMNVKNILGLRLFRTIYYLPSVLSGVAVFLLWQWLLDPTSGLVNNALAMIGIDGPAWLYDVNWTKPALVLMKLWGVGGTTVILLSSLQSVPQELYEAAAIDGASGFKRYFNITLPMISPTLFFVMVTGISGAFQVFDSAYIMMNGTGGPDNSLLFYNLYLFNTAIKDQQMGTACAMAWILFVIIMTFTIVQMIGSRKWVYYDGGSGKK